MSNLTTFSVQPWASDLFVLADSSHSCDQSRLWAPWAKLSNSAPAQDKKSPTFEVDLPKSKISDAASSIATLICWKRLIFESSIILRHPWLSLYSRLTDHHGNDNQKSLFCQDGYFGIFQPKAKKSSLRLRIADPPAVHWAGNGLSDNRLIFARGSPEHEMNFLKMLLFRQALNASSSSSDQGYFCRSNEVYCWHSY